MQLIINIRITVWETCWIFPLPPCTDFPGVYKNRFSAYFGTAMPLLTSLPSRPLCPPWKVRVL